jgi:tRNA(adenine34) deaminase
VNAADAGSAGRGRAGDAGAGREDAGVGRGDVGLGRGMSAGSADGIGAADAGVGRGVTAADRYAGWMRTALDAAAEAPATGDVPIGAVLLDASGDEIARGCNEREATGDPTAHAEVLALRRAAERTGSWRLDGCTLVVTLEPCTMCAGALVLARIERLVFGAWDPKAGAVGSLWDVVRDRRLNHRPEVVAGVLEDECGAVLRDFFAGHRP